ncbi:MAG: efflux RND transporter permease subunit [Tractidigestivibacter sp.]|jgi:predicted RND superfamily exporter protein|uniref:efflux RND transporter permease subunit n=1 Tax=Tractidigestivibacter sp. TaxID=2847320 RepID=UPI003D8C2646
MEKFFRGVLRHRKLVITVFVVLTVICAACIPQVAIDANMSDYLPESAKSSQDLDAMKEIYGNDIANARVYVTGISQADAQSFAETLNNEDSVISVTWLGDEVDLSEPLEVQDQDTIDEWYNADADGYLYSVVLPDDTDQAEIDHIRSEAQAIEGAETVAIDGSAASTAYNMSTISSDMTRIMAIAVVVVFLVVLLNTTSYLHPVVMLLTIGVAIVLNMGTNIFRGTISNITQLVSSVLQLAVSMDYSIVLLTNFGRAREHQDDQFEAMVEAMTKSFSVILSSAAVTFFGFLSLSAMQFQIGADMGIALAKGIVCSFFSITLLMPCILYGMRNAVEKTTHAPFFKSFKGMARFCTKGAGIAFAIAAVLAVPCLMASSNVSFTYSQSASLASDAPVKTDGQIIDDAFGESQVWAIMVPEGQWANEKALVDELDELPTTKSVLSYDTIATSALPYKLGDESDVSQLLNNGWSRIVLTSNINDESEESYQLVDTVRGLCSKYYGDDYKLVGNTVSYYDIRSVTTSDNTTVKLASILAIGIVLLIMFKSISIPIILIMAIEVSIWINEAVPYFTGETINFVAFLVIDAVQLGAAVDYAIIYTEEYLKLRRKMPKKKASVLAIEHTAQPIMTSSSILILACLGIYFSVSSPMIQQVGMLIARGALISVIEIFFVLPLLFRILDGFVRHTSYKIGFYQGSDNDEGAAKSLADTPATNGANAQ